ncbi:uncharacterized protein K452DRAFT_312015 [Aplosporella prunicola CBS 121167]|uniref:Uncharacterized protein n=1 Tax=Aplosporella prunicola CBS 121167 TaxID=1176127 RepID=A0A6A6B4I1_9PEZI|nr:uncharacterized protein K452DRAFT_312015 [Aplosporella prunicola CBS 121167]KAF2137877.1 hypothetical protein K452DRAFT_312015 [Aplosporella prunicola CBS 121167]
MTYLRQMYLVFRREVIINDIRELAARPNVNPTANDRARLAEFNRELDAVDHKIMRLVAIHGDLMRDYSPVARILGDRERAGRQLDFELSPATQQLRDRIVAAVDGDVAQLAEDRREWNEVVNAVAAGGVGATPRVLDIIARLSANGNRPATANGVRRSVVEVNNRDRSPIANGAQQVNGENIDGEEMEEDEELEAVDNGEAEADDGSDEDLSNGNTESRTIGRTSRTLGRSESHTLDRP